MYIVPKAFSKDLRERVVEAYNNCLGTIPELADLFSIGESTVSKYLKIFRETGDLTPGKSSGRTPILNEQVLNTIREIVLSSPDDRLQDYCLEFEKKTGVSIAKSTLWDACQILNIRRKKRASTQKSKNLKE